jgi:hypothetical protein
MVGNVLKIHILQDSNFWHDSCILYSTIKRKQLVISNLSISQIHHLFIPGRSPGKSTAFEIRLQQVT